MGLLLVQAMPSLRRGMVMIANKKPDRLRKRSGFCFFQEACQV
jgi:hypothetical protein